MDEVGIYDRALSAGEVEAIHTAGRESDGWDVADDFSITRNPNGRWSYGSSASLGGAFRGDHTSVILGDGTWHWVHPVNQLPSVAYNPTDAPANFLLPRQAAAHPGPNGSYGVVRWIAPQDGVVNVVAEFTGRDSSTTDVHILHNSRVGQQVFSGTISGFGSAQSFDGTVTVAAGDTLDFLVGDGGNGYVSDTTSVAATIRYPGPASSADLAVTITDSPDPVPVGSPVTYSVTVTNNGPVAATGVSVVARGPVDLPFNSVTIPVGELASGATRSFQLVFTPAVVGTFSATATVTATENDPNLTNNSFTATTQIAPKSTFELAQAQYEVREGDGFAVLTVRRTGDISGTARVDYTTVDGTATTPSGQRKVLFPDYTSSSGTLSFRRGPTWPRSGCRSGTTAASRRTRRSGCS